jgi:hypothetical protein
MEDEGTAVGDDIGLADRTPPPQHNLGILWMESAEAAALQ